MNVQTLRKAIASVSASVLLLGTFIVPGMGVNVASAQTSDWAYNACANIVNLPLVPCSNLNAPANRGQAAAVFLKVGGWADNSELTTARAAAELALDLGFMSGENGDANNLNENGNLVRAATAQLVVNFNDVLETVPAGDPFSDAPFSLWYGENTAKLRRGGAMDGVTVNGVKLAAGAQNVTVNQLIAFALQGNYSAAVVQYGIDNGMDLPSREDIVGNSVFNTAVDFYDGFIDASVAYEGGVSVPTPTPGSLTVRARDLGQRSVPQGANNVLFATYDLTGAANLSEITFQRFGAGDEIDIQNTYVYFGSKSGDTTRITTGKSINSDDQRVTFFLNAGVTGGGVLEVRGDLSLTAAASSQHGFRIVSVKAGSQTWDFDVTDSSVTSSLFTVSGATVGTATFRNNGSLNDLYVGEKGGQFTRFEVQLDSTEGAILESLTLQLRGGVSGTDMENFRLYTIGRSEPIAESDRVGFNDLLTFNVCAEVVNGECRGLAINKGDTKVFYANADLIGAQTGETIDVNFDETTDARVIGTTLGYGLRVNTTAFNTSVNVLGADVVVKFKGPSAGKTSSGLNSATLAEYDLVVNSDRVQGRNWTVRLFNDVNANLLNANNRFTNMRLVAKNDAGVEIATLFSSVDMNSASVTAPIAAVVNGINGFESTITFNGTYDFVRGSYVIAFVANLETTLQTSNAIVTLVNLSVGDKFKDENNDPIDDVKPSSDQSGTAQNIVSQAVQVTSASTLGNPSYAVGETNRKLASWNLLANAGVDLNFSRLVIGVVAGPVGGAGLNSNTRSTHLNVRLMAMINGVLTQLSDPESFDTSGQVQFDNLEGVLVVKNNTSMDLYLVADINTSGVVSGGTPYQFQIVANSGVATNQDGRNIATANIFPANITGQLVTVSLGGTILLNDQAQVRTQYVAQTTSNSTTLDALAFRLESQNATSQLDDMLVDVDTGIPGITTTTVIALPAATDTLTITQPAGVNGVGAFPAIVCTVAFAVAATDTDCTNGTANFDIASAAFDTIPELAAGLRTLTSHLFVMSGSGNGLTFTHSRPAVDGNFAFAGTNFATNFSTVINEVVGQRSGQAAGRLTVTGVPANASTLIIGDTVTANICTVTFTAGGPADGDCDGIVAGVAVVDITANNTAALVAARLGELTRVVGYELVTSGTIVSVTHTFPLVAATTAFTGTQATITTVNTVPGTATAPNLASNVISAAKLIVDDQEVGTATTVTNNQIRFDDLNYDLASDQPAVIKVRVWVKQVVTGGAVAGQFFRLNLRRDVFKAFNGGSFLTLAGQELNPSTSPINTSNEFVVQRKAPSFRNGPNTGDLLSVGLLQFGNYIVDGTGTGTTEIGDGLANSQFMVKITKSAAVAVNSCELRDSGNTVLATKSSVFDSDAFGTAYANQAAQDAATVAYVRFLPANFSSGKRISANGATYSIYCNITGFNTNSSMQVSISEDVRLAFVDNDTSIINLIAKILGIPVTFVSRVSTN